MALEAEPLDDARRDIRSRRMITRVFAGGSESLARDDELDNATLYRLTNTAVFSARLS